MQFDSFTFLIFFALLLAGYNLLRGWNARKNFLLCASYVFYAGWQPAFLLLLIASTTFNWQAALRIAAAATPTSRKRWMQLALVVNLSVLGWFKYALFLIDSAASLLAAVGIAWQPPQPEILLPIGISFYTFHCLSYCIDVYRGKFAPVQSWRDFALYVGFFPQLVAGPIVRWSQMGEQIATPRGSTVRGVGLGLALLTLGLFEKIVLADGVFAGVADGVFNHAGAASSADTWLGMIAFSGQVFCDFAGYSSCALGSALALGFQLPVNFRQPYASVGFADFWRRWHLSLSTWLRDYLYVGLGGNRGAKWKTYRNVMLTMLLGGLWHGAAWTFVAWGGLNGLYLVIERFVRERFWPKGYVAPIVAQFAYGAVTLLAILYGRIWFRSSSFADGWLLSTKLVDFSGLAAGLAATSFEQRLAAIVFALVVLVQVILRNHDARDLLDKMSKPLLMLLLAGFMVLIALSPGDNHAFIYFQF